MNMNTFVKIAKKAGEYFTVAAGVVSLIFTVVGAFVVVSAIIALPVAAGVGLIFAGLGARSVYNDIQAKANRKADRKAERHHEVSNLHEMKIELDEIKSFLVHCPSVETSVQQTSAVTPGCNTSAFFKVAASKQDAEFQLNLSQRQGEPVNSDSFPESAKTLTN